MFLETSSARLPPPLAAGPPRGRCWDPRPQPRRPRWAGLDRAGDPPGPAGTPSPASPGLAPPSPPGRPGTRRERRRGPGASARPPRAHARPLERASERGRARGKDFELSIERVSVLFLIKGFFKWWRWPKFHTVENKERRKGCVGAARAWGQAGGAREALTQANTLAVRGNIFCFWEKKT